MALEAENGDDFFLLKSIDPNKQNLGFLCQAPTPESLEEWVSRITHILQKQKDFLKAIQSPIAYQKELTRDA